MKKVFIYIFVCLLIIVMNWEHQRSVAASIVNETSSIPGEAIRLRILANTDTPEDQWLKREVRNEVVKQITSWVGNVKTITQAREEIKASLEDINEIVGQTIKSRGYSYTYSVEYGEIAFPSKLYGKQYYPAGQYEGVLITIGAGQGDNWWCVLFPPLCFVDFGTGEAVNSDKQTPNNQMGRSSSESSITADETKVQVRFFLVDLFYEIKSFLFA